MSKHSVSLYPPSVRHFLNPYPVKNPKKSTRNDQVSFEIKEKLPNYKKNVYYFWWEFLRLNEEYKQYCLGKGDGTYDALFHDFGDVYDTDDFWDWWKRHSDLFCENNGGAVKEISEVLNDNDDSAAYVRIPLHLSAAYIEKRVKDIVAKKQKEFKKRKVVSTAKYEVYTSPTLKKLYYCLRCYQLRQKHTDWSNNQIADALGIGSDSTREAVDVDKQIRDAVTRYLRQAKQLIENVGQGEFPRIDKR